MSDNIKQPNEKYCHECGQIIRITAEICPKCGIRQGVLEEGAIQKYCHECGEVIRAIAEICPKCGIRQKVLPGRTATKSSGTYSTTTSSNQTSGTKSKVAAGVLAITLGAFGVHHFYTGNNKWGAIHLAITIIGACVMFGPPICLVLSLIEGIKILQMSDSEFIQACENDNISLIASFLGNKQHK